jgi:hypothetical protein
VWNFSALDFLPQPVKAKAEHVRGLLAVEQNVFVRS